MRKLLYVPICLSAKEMNEIFIEYAGLSDWIRYVQAIKLFWFSLECAFDDVKNASGLKIFLEGVCDGK